MIGDLCVDVLKHKYRVLNPEARRTFPDVSSNLCRTEVKSFCINFFPRDALIASVLDGVRASGNRDVCVRMEKTPRGFRLGQLVIFCYVTEKAILLDAGFLPIYQASQRIYGFGNHCWKERKCCVLAFSAFPTMFSQFDTHLSFQLHYCLASA